MKKFTKNKFVQRQNKPFTSTPQIFQTANLFFFQQRYDEAIPLFEECLIKNPNNHELAIEIFSQLFNCHFYLHQDQEALEAFERMEKLIEEYKCSKNNLLIAKTYGQMSSLFANKDPEKALSYSEEELQILTSLSFCLDEDLVNGYMRNAKSLLNIGQISKSQVQAQKALDISSNSTSTISPLIEAECLFTVGEGHHELQEAKKYMNKGINTLIDLFSKMGQDPETSLDLGVSYHRFGNRLIIDLAFDEGLQYLLKAYNIYTLSREIEYIDDSLLSSMIKIGTTYIEMINYDQAEIWLNRALEFCENISYEKKISYSTKQDQTIISQSHSYMDPNERFLKICDILTQLGILEKKRNKDEKMFFYFEKLLQNIKEKEESNSEMNSRYLYFKCMVLIIIGDYHFEYDRVDQAAKFYCEALPQLPEGETFVAPKITLMRILGNLSLNNFRFDEGKQWILNSIQLAEEYNFHTSSSAQFGEIYQECIILYAEKFLEPLGDYKMALKFYLKAHQCSQNNNSESPIPLVFLSHTYFLLGDYEKSKDFLKKSMESVEKKKNSVLIGLHLDCVLLNVRLCGKLIMYKEALQLLEDVEETALKLCLVERRDFYSFLVSIKTNSSDKEGAIKEGKKHLKLLKERYKDSPNHIEFREAYWRLGKAAENLVGYSFLTKKAEKYFLKAKKILLNQKIDTYYSNSWRNLLSKIGTNEEYLEACKGEINDLIKQYGTELQPAVYDLYSIIGAALKDLNPKKAYFFGKKGAKYFSENYYNTLDHYYTSRRLFYIYLHNSDLLNAEKILFEIDKVTEKDTRANSDAKVMLLYKYALINYFKGEKFWSKGKEYLLKSSKILFESNDIQRKQHHSLMSSILLSLFGEYNWAEKMILKSLETPISNIPDFSKKCLGFLHWNKKDFQKAKSYFEQTDLMNIPHHWLDSSDLGFYYAFADSLLELNEKLETAKEAIEIGLKLSDWTPFFFLDFRRLKVLKTAQRLYEKLNNPTKALFFEKKYEEMENKRNEKIKNYEEKHIIEFDTDEDENFLAEIKKVPSISSLQMQVKQSYFSWKNILTSVGFFGFLCSFGFGLFYFWKK